MVNVKTPLLMTVMFLGLLVPVVSFPGPVQAAAGPTLALNLDTSMQTATVSSKAVGTVMFRGTVSLDPVPQNVTSIKLSASIDKGWQASCNPATILISSPTAQPFSVTVTVPAGTSSEVVGTLNVSAVGRSNETDVRAYTQAIVSVAPYSGVKMECGQDSRQMKPGTEINFSVQVRNDGNGLDSYDLAIVDPPQPGSDHLKVTLGSTTLVKIPPGQSKNVTVVVECPQGGVPKGERNTTFILSATSVNSRDSGILVFAQCPLHVQVLQADQKKNPQPGFILPGMILATCIALAARTIKMKDD